MADTILALTELGQALKAKIEMGSGDIPLQITRIVSAAGTALNPTELTGLVNPKLEFRIMGAITNGARTTINALMTNMGDPGHGIPALATGYPLSQIGFYAIDPDLGEILYRITQYDSPMYVPASTERVWSYNPSFNIVTGNAATVVIEISTVGYAPMSALTDHVESTVASEAGVHGLRFFDGRLQFWNGNSWGNIITENPGQFLIADGVLSNSIQFGTITPNDTANTLVFNDGLATVNENTETLNLL